MKKRLQNQIAESGLTLPVVAVYTGIVWLLAGLITHHWWIQFALLGFCTFLFVELNNTNALIRVRNRMVGSTFLVLSSAPCALFGSVSGALFALSIMLYMLFLFQTYQDPYSVGRTFYSYLFIGLGSLLWVDILYFIPIMWILNYALLQSLSLRTWMASVIGVTTPYWFLLPWFVFQKDFTPITDHFAGLTDFRFPIPILSLTAGEMISFILTLFVMLVGIIHFWLKSFEDRIRIRMLFTFFGWTAVCATAFLLFQPQHYNYLIRMLIICASPFVAHYFTLTHTRHSNIFFIVISMLFVLVTILNLLTPLIPALQMSLQAYGMDH